MTYGIQSFQNLTIKNIDQSMLGGRVFVKYINQTYTGSTVDIQISNVSSGSYLKFYILSAGGYSVTAETNANGAFVRLTPLTRYSGYNSTSRDNTIILVFATQTVEPDYGILSVNDAGDRLVSSIYPVPEFLQKLTFDPNPEPFSAWDALRGTYQHYSTTPVSLGSGRKKIVLFSIPETPNDYWYILDSYFGTGTGYLAIGVEGPEIGAYGLPEAYVFAIDNFMPSSDQYGIRIYDNNGNLTFDSGLSYLSIKGFESIQYYTTETSITSNIINNYSSAVLVPGYGYETVQKRNSVSLWDYKTYRGCIRRVGNTVYTRSRLVGTRTEDGGPGDTSLYTIAYGSPINTIFAMDVANFGAGSQGLSATIVNTGGGSTTCSFNTSSASSCSTVEYFTVSLSGGTGNPISYSWSITGSGYSILGSTTSNSVTVQNTGGGGTFAGTLTCQVTQSGSTTLNPTYSLSHVHTATTDPLSASVTVSDQINVCSYTGSNTCTTSATYTIGTVSGGNGNAKTYTWSLVNNTGGFTFTTGTSGTSAGITITAAAGTYTCTIRCTVSQSGMASLVIDTPVSHTHNQVASGYLVSPMVGASNTYWNSSNSNCGGNSAYASCEIVVSSAGQLWIRRNSESIYTSPGITAWWSEATYVPGGGVPGIGSSFWVRFIRTSSSSQYSSTLTTGWLSLQTDQSAQVDVSAGGGNSDQSNEEWAVYTVEVASTSTGGSPISTTEGIRIEANASYSANCQ